MIFSQKNHVHVATIPGADAFPGTSYSDVVSLKNYNHVTFLFIVGAITGTATQAITVQACDNVTPDTRSAIAFRYKEVSDFTHASGSDVPGVLTDATTAGFSTDGTANEMYIIEVDAAALPDGYPYVQLKMIESADQPVSGAIIAIFSEPRFTDDVPISVMS